MSVAPFDRSQFDVFAIVVPVRGQVGERGAVEGVQGGVHGGLVREQRAGARVDLGDLGHFPGRVLQIWPRDQQRRASPRPAGRRLPAAPGGQP